MSLSSVRRDGAHEATLLYADIVDSTRIGERLGETAAAELWARHDRIGRDLLRDCGGLEIGRSDGFLLYFPAPGDAIGFASRYHRALADFEPPLFARIGIHTGPIVLRTNPEHDRERGSTAFDVDGLALPVAARLMAVADGGRTLLSEATHRALGAVGPERRSHGHWRLKGVPEPVLLYEADAGDALREPPIDSDKAYRVVSSDGQWLPLRQVPHHLPQPGDAFVGREEELHALAARFDEGARHVTLVGIGGIGKTRLALRHARGWLGEYPGGAWFCDLSPARSLDGLVHAVALALDVPLGRSDPVRQLGRAMAGRGRCLIVLDNFEQVARHADATLAVWMAEAPEAGFLVTSREVLGLPGEQVQTLPPLPTQDAMHLFEKRAGAAGVPAATDGDELERLVVLLDRVPLAIELAASRTVVMPAAEQLRRIGERFKLLARVGQRRDRQSTLRATLDWSWELLSQTERGALAQLSVFERGFSLAAAEAVVDLPSGSAEWTADVIQSLVGKSLVRRVDGRRFDLLRMVQEYAGERLASAATATMRRHWRYFAALPDGDATAGRCIESENLVAACSRAVDLEPDTAAVLLSKSWVVLRLTGPFRVALALGARLREQAALSLGARATVERVLGSARSLLGERQAARVHHESALAAAAAVHDSSAQAQIACLIADLDIGSGRHEAAEERLGFALKQSDSSADNLARLMAHNGMGWLAVVRSRHDEAAVHFQRTLTLAEALGDLRWQGGARGNLGSVALVAGRLDEARRHLEAGLAIAVELGDRQWEGNSRSNLGLLLHEAGEEATARVQLERALEIAATVGHSRLEATACSNLALVLEQLGDRDGALRLHERAVATASALADTRLEAEMRGYLGVLLARLGQAERSQTCIDRAVELLGADGDPALQGVLASQRALSLAASGQERGATEALREAQRLIEPLELDAKSEPRRALAQAGAAVREISSPG